MALPLRKKALIQTERLTLKPYSMADVDALAGLLIHPEITKTFMVPDFESPEQAKALAEKLVNFSRIEDTAHLEYGIYLNGALIGFINDCGIEDEEIEIGYVVHPDFQGHGYATDARSAARNGLPQGHRRLFSGKRREPPRDGKMRHGAHRPNRRG